MSQDNKPLEIKGFRAQAKPTKGDVAKENQELSTKIMGMLNFMNQQMLNLMRKSHQYGEELGALSELLGYEKSTEPLQDGDKALIGFLGRLTNEDGTPGDLFPGSFSKMTLIGVGAGQFIAELEAALQGAQVGAQLEIPVVFPDNYPPELKGKKATFDVVIYAGYRPLPNVTLLSEKHAAIVEAKLAVEKAEAEKIAAQALANVEAADKAAQEPQAEVAPAAQEEQKSN